MIQFYVIGCILAFCALLKDYQEEFPNVCNNKEAIIIIAIGTFASWFTVLTLVLFNFTKK